MEGTSPPVKSANRAMDILELLAQRPGALEAATIARLCAIPRSTTYALLRSLEERGFVATTVPHRWSLGVRLVELGASAPSIGDSVVVMDAFGKDGERLDVVELARRTQFHLVTLDRILAQLVREGLVNCHDDSTYSLGLRLAVLCGGFGPLDELRAAARPVLMRLRDLTGETSGLLVRDGDAMIYVEQFESRHPLRHAGWLGRRIPVECSASGRALETGNPGTEVARDTVEVGVTGVASVISAAPTHDATASVTGPTLRLQGGELESARRLVADASAAISARLRSQTVSA
jgi:DNA-binding IclR family transcriptional regulator